jgi:hypothetical protein
MRVKTGIGHKLFAAASARPIEPVPHEISLVQHAITPSSCERTPQRARVGRADGGSGCRMRCVFCGGQCASCTPSGNKVLSSPNAITGISVLRPRCSRQVAPSRSAWPRLASSRNTPLRSAHAALPSWDGAGLRLFVAGTSSRP